MKVLETPAKETGLYKTLMRDVVVVDGGPRHLFTWRVALGPVNCPYVVRWVLDLWRFGMGSIRLHHWLRSDDLRAPHDHGWWFVSLVLWGSLIDRTDRSDTRRGWLSVSFFDPLHRHSVVVEEPAWTLLITGKECRTWGYWVNGRFRKRNKYFFEHGHHDPCA